MVNNNPTNHYHMLDDSQQFFLKNDSNMSGDFPALNQGIGLPIVTYFQREIGEFTSIARVSQKIGDFPQNNNFAEFYIQANTMINHDEPSSLGV